MGQGGDHLLERGLNLLSDQAEHAVADIRAADAMARARLQAAQPRPYWVLHDSLQYFEKRYGLHGAGAIMVSPDRTPGAKRVLALRRQLHEQNIGCILYEERYGRRWIEMLSWQCAANSSR